MIVNDMIVNKKTSLLGVLMALCLTSEVAWGLTTDYDLLFDDSVVGGFSVDPDLAASIGLSDVNVSALDLSVDVSGYGLVSFTLADVTGGFPIRARFLDGELASLTTAGATGALPGSGDGFLLDLTPFIPADVSLIDLLNAGQYNLFIAIAPDFPDRIGSFGMALSEAPSAPIPEPGGLVLFGAGIVAAGLGRRR